MKKQLILLIIITSIIAFFLIKPNKKDNEKISNNSFITILLENEKGNTKVNEFPSKENYTYDKIKCNNLDKDTSFIPVFNEENWKLNINLNSLNKMDGNFNCEIYFKEKEKVKATDIIAAKYSENNIDGLIKIEQPATVQTKATTEYRYSGNNDVVKNYVNFNNETWRIIGVFDVENEKGELEKRIKLVREESIGNYSWDSSSSNINTGFGSNQWGESGSYPGSDLMQELNDLYYNAKSGTCYNGLNNASTTCNFETIGLNENSRKMISNAKWYTGTSEVDNTTSSQSYIKERSNTVGATDIGQTIIKTSNWIGKVALLYPSDYGYSSSSCYYGDNTLVNYSNSLCTNTNWIFNKEYHWLLSPVETNYRLALIIDLSGCVYAHGTICYDRGIYPSVYLSPNVKITKGTGTIDNKYELSL